MKDLQWKVVIVVCLLMISILSFFSGWIIRAKKGNKSNNVRPMHSYLVQVVDDPNWITNYGVDLESRLVYNVALLNQIVNRQGLALKKLLEDPNR